jgi:hypothetical protein
MLIFGRGQLRRVLAEYADRYNGRRPHRALGQAPPLEPGEPPGLTPARRVVRRGRLGGLIHEYAQVAWREPNIWHPHVELANLTRPTLGELIDQAHRGIQRVRCTPHLAYSFLRHAGLSVSCPTEIA